MQGCIKLGRGFRLGTEAWLGLADLGKVPSMCLKKATTTDTPPYFAGTPPLNPKLKVLPLTPENYQGCEIWWEAYNF